MVGQLSMANSHRHWEHEVVMVMPITLKKSAICVFLDAQSPLLTKTLAIRDLSLQFRRYI